MKGWLEEAGLEQVQERTVMRAVGNRNGDGELGRLGVEADLMIARGFAGGARGKWFLVWMMRWCADGDRIEWGGQADAGWAVGWAGEGFGDWVEWNWSVVSDAVHLGQEAAVEVERVNMRNGVRDKARWKWENKDPIYEEVVQI
jgi:hypothetical protein